MFLGGISEPPLVGRFPLCLKKSYGQIKTKGVKRNYVYKVKKWTEKKEHGGHVYVGKIL
jgi:hypothetical protein